jgi:hypothetical protein
MRTAIACCCCPPVRKSPALAVALRSRLVKIKADNTTQPTKAREECPPGPFFVREGTNDERMTGMIARRGVWTFGCMAAFVGLMVCMTKADAELGGTVTRTEPAGTLVMPFDSTSGKASSAGGATRCRGDGRRDRDALGVLGGGLQAFGGRRHLSHPRDTVVVDPTALQAEVQTKNGNEKTVPSSTSAASAAW